MSTIETCAAVDGRVKYFVRGMKFYAPRIRFEPPKRSPWGRILRRQGFRTATLCDEYAHRVLGRYQRLIDSVQVPILATPKKSQKPRQKRLVKGLPNAAK